jgi:folate-binding protein YgfZ
VESVIVVECATTSRERRQTDRVDDNKIPDAAIDENARDRVTVTGPDAQSYLHSQVAQDISAISVGETCWTFVLEPTGKVVALARLTRLADDTFVLDTDAGYGQQLLDRLQRFMIRVKAELALQPADRSDPAPQVEAARVAAGWPRMGAEIVPGETIPGVTGVSALAVSYTKGCYPGQELVERMDSRGAEPPRSLRIFDVGTDAGPGDPILDADGKQVGELSSVAGAKGLGYVKRGADVGRPPSHT